MWIYIVVLGIIWIGLLIPVVQERRAWIVFAHGGSGVFFTSILLSLGFHQTGDLADIAWLEVIGFFLFIPAAILMVFAMISLVKENLVKTGIMKIVRHPMYLGTSIAAFALILAFQSISSIVLSVTAIVLLWIASKLEDEYNIERFGDSYREYVKLVPGWNVFKGIKKR